MIELVVALLILGLLIAVAVSSVMDHAVHKARHQATVRLNEVADWMRQNKAAQPDYSSMLAANWSTPSSDARYVVSLARKPVPASDPKMQFPATAADVFTLQASPSEPDDCGVLLLDHAGRRGVTGKLPVHECWQ